MPREPAHDAPLVEIAGYFVDLWKERVSSYTGLTEGDARTPEGIAARLTIEYQRKVAEGTLALWTARREYEQAMASGKREQNGRSA